MNALALMATLGLDSSEYEKGLGESKKSANSFAKSITKILGGIAIGAAVKKTLDGITAITKSVVKAYGDFQQLEGGIDALFGNGGQSLEQYAASASKSLYKMGQRGEDVKKLQEELIKNGYDIGASGADGIYGPKTQAAFDAYSKAGGQMVKDAYDQSNKVSELVKANADEAYRTANLSANEYMETAIGFSGALLKAVGNDSQKAADLTDMAIRDMGDQANRYGRTVEEISGTYMSIARGNYMTLDNLFGGMFKGSKQGLEDMLKYAEDYQASIGNAVDYSIDSYADILQALHDVSVATGTYETTLRESQDTIQGSLKMTQASWQNLLVAFGRGQNVRKAMNNLTKSARRVIENVVPVVKNALIGFGEMVQELGPVIIEELPGIVEDLLPTLLSAAGSLITAFARALPGILNAVWSSARTALGTFGAWLAEQSPILGSLFDGLSSVIGRISEDIEALVSGEKSVGEVIIGWFTDAKEKIGEIDWAEVGTTIKTKILDGIRWISRNVQGFFNDAKRLIQEINWAEVGQFILDAITGILGGAADILKKLFDDGKAAIEEINWVEVGTNIWNAIKSAFSGIWAAFGRIFSNGKDGAENGPDWVGLGKSIMDSILAGLDGIGTAISTLIHNGIKDITGLDVDAESIKDALEVILGAILSYNVVAGVTGIIGGLTSAFAAFKAVGLAGLLGNPVALAISAVTAVVLTLWETSSDFRDVVGGIFEGIRDFIKDPMSKIQEFIQFGVDKVNGFLTAAQDLRDKIGAVFSDVFDTVKEWWDKIVEPIQNAINKVLEFLGLKAKTYDESYVGDIGPVLPGYENPYQTSDGIKINPYMDAVSMPGRIYNHMTPFGVDENGRMHVAGDAGPEAVVGTSSLNQMIQQSVNNALGGAMAPVVEAMKNMRLVADTGEVLAWLAPSMDEELNTLATWKEGGRA